MTIPVEVAQLLAIVLIFLLAATLVGALLARLVHGKSAQAKIHNTNLRIRGWWPMCGVIALAVISGKAALLILFCLVSAAALREFIQLIPQTQNDTFTRIFLYFVLTPLQYIFIAIGSYGLLATFIPVVGFLFMSSRAAMRGNCNHFLQHLAEVQWGLMVCVYCLSYSAGLLMLNIPSAHTITLLCYLLLVVQLSDIFQYLFGTFMGRHKVAPQVSPNKTWEGLIGGVLSATLVGSMLWRLTPFACWQAALLSLLIAVMGFLGGLTMSAIKRDRGIKDYGTILAGHGGMLDRVGSLCFAAPIFFHVVRYFFAH